MMTPRIVVTSRRPRQCGEGELESKKWRLHTDPVTPTRWYEKSSEGGAGVKKRELQF